MSDDDLLDAARDAGLPVQEEVQTIGTCRNPDCDEELPDKGPRKMNLGVEDGYCNVACLLAHDGGEA